jgi:hypothetical protein
MIRSFQLKPSTIHERFGDEIVIINLDSGAYYSAQGMASIIWGAIVEGASEANVRRRIEAEFSGNSDEISYAIAKFLDQLVEESLADAHYVVDSEGEQAGVVIGAPEKVFTVPLLQKYTDMEEMLLLDPIHEVDEQGWPSARKSPD